MRGRRSGVTICFTLRRKKIHTNRFNSLPYSHVYSISYLHCCRSQSDHRSLHSAGKYSLLWFSVDMTMACYVILRLLMFALRGQTSRILYVCGEPAIKYSCRVAQQPDQLHSRAIYPTEADQPLPKQEPEWHSLLSGTPTGSDEPRGLHAVLRQVYQKNTKRRIH